MIILEAGPFEVDAAGADLLARVLQPSKRERSRALARGRRRLAHAAKGLEFQSARRPAQGGREAATV